MGQDDILKFLRKNKNKKFTVAELSKAIGFSISSTGRCLRILRKESNPEVQHEDFTLDRFNGKVHRYRYWIQ